MNITGHRRLIGDIQKQRTIKTRIAEAEHRRNCPKCNGVEVVSLQLTPLKDILQSLGLSPEVEPQESPHGRH